MDENGIANVCDALGLGYSRAYPGSSTWGPHMSISCPLAPKTHSDAYDGNMSCSVQVNADGSSGARCFSGNCGYKGSFLKLVKLGLELRDKTPELEKLFDHVKGVEEVTLKARYEKASAEIKKMIDGRKQAIEDKDVLPESDFLNYAGRVPQYALDRGLSLPSCKRWELGYDEIRKYLVFPLRRRDKKLVGLIGRSVEKNPKRRHHNYKGLDKAKHLYGAHLLEAGKPIVIVEGCIDAIKTDQALLGEACVVAALGEGFSQNHAKTICAMHPPTVYIFTDGDPGGHMLGSKIEYALHGKVPMRLMECPWGPIIGQHDDGVPVRKKVDPADLPPSYVQQLFRTARPILDKIRWSEPPPIWEPKAA